MTSRYRVTDLGTLGGETYAYALNDRGQVAGLSGGIAFLWTDRNRNGLSDPGDMVALGALAGGQSAAEGVNARGEVVGSALVGRDALGYPVRRAFLWRDGNGNGLSDPGEMQELETPDGWDSYASAINDVGDITGARVLHDPSASPIRRRGVRWKSGPYEDLSPWTDFHSAAAVNRDGRIVGEMEGSAAYWEDRNGNGGFDPHDTTLLGRIHPLVATAATGVNDLGHVVGTSGADGFLWRDGNDDGAADPGEFTLLGALLGSGPGTVPRGVNALGQVVGVSNRRAFVWRGGRMEDLNSLIPAGSGWVLEAATAINGSGQIAGWGSRNGLRRGFLLTPLSAPEADADLSLSMSASTERVPVGGMVTYTLTVRNAGPGRATGVAVTDALPESARYVSARSPRGVPSQAGWRVTFPVGTLERGTAVTLSVTVAAEAEGELVNRASVNADGKDPAAENNDAEVRTLASAPRADLALSSRAPTSVRVGGEAAFTLSLRNEGPDPATGVDLVASLPQGAALVSTSPAAAPSGSTLAFRFSRLGPGVAATARIILRPEREGSLALTAHASATEADPQPGNNRAEAAAAVAPARADLALTGAAPRAVQVGETILYTFSVTNRGPDTAPGVTLEQELPEGVVFLRARPAQGRFTRTDRRVSWIPGALAVRDTATLAVEARAQAPASLESGVSVRGTVFDPNAGNSAVTLRTEVRSRPDPLAADLALTLVPSVMFTPQGSEVTLTADLRNLGKSAASEVSLAVTLPEGAVPVSGSPGFSRSESVLSFHFGTVPTGGSARASMIVRCERVGALRFVARAAAAEPDPDRSNNLASAGLRVTPLEAAELVAAWESAGLLRRTRGGRARHSLRGVVAVRNRGTASSRPTRLRLYLSADRTLDSDDEALPDRTVPVLAPGAVVRVELRRRLSRAAYRAARGRFLLALPGEDGAPVVSPALR